MMADARQRIPIHPSHSFSDLSDTHTAARPLKRRHTSSTDDLSTASTATAPVMPSFHSKPCFPSATAPRQPVHTRATARSSGLVAHLPAMDPTPYDTDAVFIHPPFTDFPDAHRYKEGLTYNVLAAHPDWFLDPADYQQLNGVNADGVKYPSQLEPPRGWCPAKKREAKEGWAEGEEPRLRCTFCRRTYAGVNAKSMWRRHVFEKHKIAMSNRRENQDRKGRGSNKENKEGSSRPGATTARGAAKVEIQSAPSSSTSRSAYRLRPAAEISPEWKSSLVSYPSPVEGDSDDGEDSGAESQPPLSAAPDLTVPEDVLRVDARASTPPLTPAISPSPKSSCSFDFPKAIAESPYNPLLTPSFRHSPARLPSDQPWRFPSPSHPLHSSAREISLCMLAQAESSPNVRGLDVSPLLLVPRGERSKQSIFSSPLSSIAHATPDKLKESIKPTPRRLFSESMLPTPFTDRLKFQMHRSSPLAVGFTPVKRKIIPLLTPSSGAWSTSSPAKSPGKGVGLMGPIELSGDDPFTDESIRPWIARLDSGDKRAISPPDSSPEAESPVLRASQLSQNESSFADSSIESSNGTSDSVSTGLSLLEGFSLKDHIERMSAADDSDGDEVMFPQSSDDGPGPSCGTRRVLAGDGSPVPAAVAGKKTRRELFLHGSPRSDEGFLPKKRRRTVSTLRE